MGNHWVIPLVFGILFFSTVFSAQDVYGPHFTTLDGLRYDFQGFGVDSFFDITVELSDGHANPKKKADFDLCVHLTGARDTTVQTEIVALSLVSCEPIHVGPSDRKGFQLFQFRIQTDGPIETSSMIADISGFIDLRNPGGQSTGGVTDFVAENIILGPLVCVPPSCEGVDNCSGNGVCVADDTCVCEKGWSDEDCSVPQCDGTTPCPDDGDPCTVSVCHENQCAVAEIPGCIPPEERCASNDDCDDGNACTLNVCDSIGQCSNPPLPGGSSCDDGVFCSGNDFCDGNGNCTGGSPTCGEGNACDEDGKVCQCNIVIDCAVGFIPADTDGDGCPDACVPTQCVPSGAEVCDGVDNNCDGTVDDGFGLGDACSVGIGACERTGTRVCSSDGTGSICGVEPGSPSPEVCDGVDNDCDGVVDDGNPEGGQVCNTGLPGVCAAGTFVCTDGGLTCTQTTASSSEVCNGLDDDCDGQIDEGIFCNPSQCGEDTQCMFWSVNNGQCQQNFVSSGTSCDDGQFCTSGDVCDGQGACRSGGPTCTDGTCDEAQNVCIPSSFCGDGVLDPELGEQCDDGNRIDGDGCSSRCQLEGDHLVINEVDYDQPGEDTREFIEIYNPTASPIELTGHAIRLVNSGCETYSSIDLSPARVLPSGGYLVVGTLSVLSTVPDDALRLVLPSLSNNIQNGGEFTDYILLVRTDATIDSLGYEGEELCGLSETFPHPGDEPASDFSLSRGPNGVDTDTNHLDFFLLEPTPGSSNT